MDEKKIDGIIKSLEEYTGAERQHLVADYVYDTFDEDALTTMPPLFFAKLLMSEKDHVCKWYEIKALGCWRATEYIDLLISYLMETDVKFESGSSIHLVTATALGKMGEAVVEKVYEKWSLAGSESRLAIIDTLGETRSQCAVSRIMSIIDDVSEKEYSYALLALAKCGDSGNASIRSLYEKANDRQKVYLVDALGRNVNNDTFIRTLLDEDADLLVKALNMDSKGIIELKRRIVSCSGEWDSEVKTTLCEKGVLFNA